MKTRTWIVGYQPSLAEFKAHMRYTQSTLDGELEMKLKAAILSAEHFTGLVIAQSSYVQTISYANTVALGAPLLRVDSVKIDGETISDYTFSADTGVLSLPRIEDAKTVEATYQAGMTAVPEDIKAAILLHATYLFTHPADTVETLIKASTNLLRPYRIWNP